MLKLVIVILMTRPAAVASDCKPYGCAGCFPRELCHAIIALTRAAATLRLGQ